MESTLVAKCQCGRVQLDVSGAPIIAVACYCNSCQRGGHLLEQFPGAPTVVGADGGTEYVLYRKDRVRVLQGTELLAEQRLEPDSPTRRVRATCCQSPMFLDLGSGHWLSIYRGRLGPSAAPITLRSMTRYRPAGVELANDVPNHAEYSGTFIWRLLKARVAMGWSVPKLSF